MRNRTAPYSRSLVRTVFGVAAIAAIVVPPLYAYKIWIKTDYTDFNVYYRAAERVKNGDWPNVYTLADGASPFRYAPVTIPFFRPFAELSPEHAKMAWYALQLAWFGAAFALIFLALKRLRTSNPLFITAIAFLFILRFCLDAFTIGQVSSLLFLGFCASFYGWTVRRPGLASTSLLVPSIFKIGPGFVYPLFLKGRWRDQVRAVLTPLITMLALFGAAWIWTGPNERNQALWSSWLQIVAQDSNYYDASHYGSQSVKSALLRLANAGWLTQPSALTVYAIFSVAVCGAILFYWLFRRPRGFFGRATFFCLGIFPYLWVMPETFKYSLTTVAIPVVLLVAALERPSIRTSTRRAAWIALVFGALTLSLAGKDIIGDTLFFGMQKASMPLLATLLLGWATFLLSRDFSEPSRFGRSVADLFFHRTPGPWQSAWLDQVKPTLEISAILPAPLDSNSEFSSPVLNSALSELIALLEKQAPGRYEILIEPYGSRVSELHPQWIALREFVHRTHPDALVSFGPTQNSAPHRGLALRQAYFRSRGTQLLFLNAEQPCAIDFYDRALQKLQDGFALVRGNRRHSESRFRIPVSLLRFVYRRHRMGLAFNRLVRFVLPIETTDTHSGHLAIQRSLAHNVFTLQSSIDFLFDLELALIARAHQAREIDLPVTLRLAVEKSRKRVAGESIKILFGLPILARRSRQGCYQPFRLSHQFTADDWGLSPEVNYGILELARAGVIRRVSVMAKSRYISEGLNELLAIPTAELGLHFDLTYGRSSPGRVMAQWLKPGADRPALQKEVQEEFRNQIQTLQKHGIPIRYLDGHHHIHLVPGILDAIAPQVREAGIQIVRLPYDPDLWWTGKAPLNVLSVMARSAVRNHGFQSLPCFYPQASHFQDLGRFRAHLSRVPGSEVIVHPARKNDLEKLEIQDPYTEGRVTEYRALSMLVHPEL